jgi:hypothetical protein
MVKKSQESTIEISHLGTCNLWLLLLALLLRAGGGPSLIPW